MHRSRRNASGGAHGAAGTRGRLSRGTHCALQRRARACRGSAGARGGGQWRTWSGNGCGVRRRLPLLRRGGSAAWRAAGANTYTRGEAAYQLRITAIPRASYGIKYGPGGWGWGRPSPAGGAGPLPRAFRRPPAPAAARRARARSAWGGKQGCDGLFLTSPPAAASAAGRASAPARRAASPWRTAAPTARRSTWRCVGRGATGHVHFTSKRRR